jgi:DNA recombination protein RmuC
MSENFVKLGSAIEKSAEMYNQTVGSLEKNVLPSARKFRELRPANAEQLADIAEIEAMPRRLDAGKWPALEAAERN